MRTKTARCRFKKAGVRPTSSLRGGRQRQCLSHDAAQQGLDELARHERIDQRGHVRGAHVAVPGAHPGTRHCARAAAGRVEGDEIAGVGVAANVRALEHAARNAATGQLRRHQAGQHGAAHAATLVARLHAAATQSLNTKQAGRSAAHDQTAAHHVRAGQHVNRGDGRRLVRLHALCTHNQQRTTTDQ